MTAGVDVTAERRAMVRSLFDLIDRRDVEAFVAAFTPDAVQVMGNQPPMRGPAAIREGNNGFLFSIAGLRHEVTGLWEADRTVIVRLLVHYERLDGRSVTLPCVTVFTEDAAGLIEHYQVFFDVAPILAE